MTLQEFKTKFSPFIPTANFSSPSLDENAFVQKFCKEMIADAFPLLVPFQDQLLKNYMYSEYKSVIANIYDGLCFALETGWFEIGLDKCSRPTTNPNNVEFFAVQTTGTHIYNVRVITNSAVQPTHILADSESSYRKHKYTLERNGGDGRRSGKAPRVLAWRADKKTLCFAVIDQPWEFTPVFIIVLPLF